MRDNNKEMMKLFKMTYLGLLFSYLANEVIQDEDLGDIFISETFKMDNFK